MAKENVPFTTFELYSSFVVFILNNLNISTITSGTNTSAIVSIILVVGKTGMLNTSLKNGTNSITNISAADTAIANNKYLLLKY